jgi:hypothetical protein
MKKLRELSIKGNPIKDPIPKGRTKYKNLAVIN